MDRRSFIRQTGTIIAGAALAPYALPEAGAQSNVSTASGRQVLLVATKSDRLSNNQLNNVLRTLGQEYPSARLLPFSSKTGAGRDELWKQIREVAVPVSAERPSPATGR